ncbi:MAG: class I SAM-dependent methyltransferase [Pseudonocardiales bacterium]
MSPLPAAQRWREELAAWAIPEEILAAAPESPWGFPVELFRVSEASAPPETPSRRRALEALPEGGSVLDVGCGGGAASLALLPRAARLVGVDPSADLLAEFAAAADRRGVRHEEVLGRWPDSAGAVEWADVVVCHHVTYNVPALATFANALADRARRRVVVEMTDRHPMTSTSDLWRHFHGITRPSGPDVALAVAVLADAGIPVNEEPFQRPARDLPRAVVVAATRRRLCLTSDRDGEIDAVLPRDYTFPARTATCLWWDKE